jgi:hypothetical protein
MYIPIDGSPTHFDMQTVSNRIKPSDMVILYLINFILVVGVGIRAVPEGSSKIKSIIAPVSVDLSAVSKF